MILGITGGICTGKTTVTDILVKQGVRIIDADELSHHLANYDTKVLTGIRSAFGNQVFKEYGALDRPALAKVAFGDEQQRKVLESILHPPIVASIQDNIAMALEMGHPLVVSAPLLFEAGLQKNVVTTWVVSCSEQKQIERLCSTRQMNEDHARQRIAAQMPMAQKERLADTVIKNDSSIEELETLVLREWHSLVRV